jgi:hypothetical protein
MQSVEAFFVALEPLLPAGVVLNTTGEEWDENGAPPEIAIYPSTEEFAAPTQANRQDKTGRAILTRRVTMPVKLWGDTIACTEELLRAFTVACRRICTGPYFAISGGQWLRSKSLVKCGHILQVLVTVDFALQEDQPNTVRPTDMTITHEVLDAPP